jgi:hypothetical protein
MAPREIGLYCPPHPAAKSARRAQPVPRPVWVQPGSDTALEKLLLGCLALAALIGIAYGFSCLVDLVQNWAFVNVGISKLI